MAGQSEERLMIFQIHPIHQVIGADAKGGKRKRLPWEGNISKPGGHVSLRTDL